MFLIIGKTNDYKQLNHINRITSIEELYSIYGTEGDLINATTRAFSLGIPYVYVCNLHSYEDYFEIFDQIKSLSIEYIVLLDNNCKKMITLKNERSLPLFLVLAELLQEFIFLITEAHCENFINFDDAIRFYNQENINYRRFDSNKKNVAFVMNQLKSSLFSNVDCACSLVLSKIGEYPLLNCGESTFQFEKEDFFSPIVYFKNGLLCSPYTFDVGIESNLVIKRVLYTIRTELDKLLSCFIGKNQKPTTQMHVTQMVREYLNKKNNIYYEHANIKRIAILKNEIIVELEVWPFNAYDAITTSFSMKGF